ncbi:MAG: penicillin-binding protein 2 [Nitriliruptoraceae bacterium]
MLIAHMLVFGVIIAQLVSIQVVNAESYADQGVRQRERVLELNASRGRIYDRNGEVLATSVSSATVYADPAVFHGDVEIDGEVVSARRAAALVAPFVGRDAGEVLTRLLGDGRFVYLGRQLDWDTGAAIRELGIPGIGVLEEPRRVYPLDGLAGPVVGFTDIDGAGLSGIESIFDDVLQGTPGELLLERAPNGLDIASGIRQMRPAEPGSDVVLAVEREIQHAAERAAADAISNADALAANVVVLDADTFEVLAMASAPGFDPNERRDEDRANWRNRPVVDVFEPGSSQKALTMAAAIEEGIVGAQTRFDVPDRIRVSTDEFNDVAPHPTESLSVTDILERSSNVGTIMIAQQLGDERLDTYLRAFGYGSTTGLGLPGESAGLLMPHESWWGTSLPTIAIGQGVAVTLLQLATAYATLANDGQARVPTVVRGTLGDDGDLVTTPGSAPTRVVSTETARQVRSMLEAAVAGEHATGQLARVPGYSVAGKTGTARKPNTDAPGYSSEYVATFVGFAPVDDPEVVVAVMVDEPTPIYGGVVAAPIFREVMQTALSVLHVVPDRSDTSLEALVGRARERAIEVAATEGPA